jgi:hypothetical protein
MTKAMNCPVCGQASVRISALRQEQTLALPCKHSAMFRHIRVDRSNEKQSMKARTQNAIPVLTAIGVDIGKDIFHIVGFG